MTRRPHLGLLACALASACDAGVTTLRLEVTLAAGESAPRSLVVALYDDRGAITADHAIAQESLSLPGRVEARLRDQPVALRVAMWGPTDAGPVVRGWARVSVGAHVENRGAIVLSKTTGDRDGDDVPDEIDNCSDTPNHDQADGNEDARGDACAAGDSGAGDLAVADLAVRDLLPPRDLSDAAGQLLLGDKQVEGNTDSHSAGQGEASAFQAVAGGGTVSSLSLYLAAGSTTTELIIGLYDDAGLPHQPRNLLTQGTIVNPTADAWNTVSVPPAAVSGGGTYWLAFVSPAGFGTFNFPYGGAAGLITSHSQQAGLSALPATWTEGTEYPDTVVSTYAAW